MNNQQNTSERKTYIGTKVIDAEPEVKDGRPGYKVYYPDGYVSWSPKDVFEEAYRPLSTQERCFILGITGQW